MHDDEHYRQLYEDEKRRREETEAEIRRKELRLIALRDQIAAAERDLDE